jgi:hypothetical protein
VSAVYRDQLHLTDANVNKQATKNPLGKQRVFVLENQGRITSA